MNEEKEFRFRKFVLKNEKSPAKIGTDGVLLGSWAGEGSPGNILDVGSGTGLITIMLAQRFLTARLLGIEIHKASAEEASANAKNSPWGDRIEIQMADFIGWTNAAEEKWDLISCNPPYFFDGTMSADPKRRSWRNSGDLIPGKFFISSEKVLAPEGRIALILPFYQWEKWTSQAESAGFCEIRRVEIRTKKEREPTRIMAEWGRGSFKNRRAEIWIQEQGPNKYSEEYIRLTKDFYPWM